MSLKPLLKSHKALNVEASLLEALLYRGKNQYRGFPFWQKVVEVKRCVSRVGDDIELLLGRLSYVCYCVLEMDLSVKVARMKIHLAKSRAAGL